MIYHILAIAVFVMHLLFIAFVLFGGVLVIFWRRLIWGHLPAVFWGAYIEFSGRICPLTPLENLLRVRANLKGFHTGIVEQVLLPVIYPAPLTRPVQMALGTLVLVVNAGLYGFLFFRMNKKAGDE